LGNVLEISVYLKQGTSPSIVKDRIKEISHVKGVTLITKEESWGNLKQELGLHDISNPLPDTLRVKADKPENINEIYNQIKPIQGVEDLGYAKELAKKMQVLTNVAHTTMIFVILISAALTITIINNTIQLVIQSRKEEIEIMRLMGVSNWYIRIPLVLQGAFYGFSGALISLIPLHFVQTLLGKMNTFLLMPNPLLAEGMVVLTLLLVGILFGALGSLLSIKKHLQV
jgi:cell division transport system permease protein